MPKRCCAREWRLLGNGSPLPDLTLQIARKKMHRAVIRSLKIPYQILSTGLPGANHDDRAPFLSKYQKEK